MLENTYKPMLDIVANTFEIFNVSINDDKLEITIEMTSSQKSKNLAHDWWFCWYWKES